MTISAVAREARSFSSTAVDLAQPGTPYGYARCERDGAFVPTKTLLVSGLEKRRKTPKKILCIICLFAPVLEISDTVLCSVSYVRAADNHSSSA